MPLTEHIGELRGRIIRIAVVLFLTLIGGLIVAQYVIAYLKSVPPASEITWNAFNPWDGIRIYMNVAFVIAFVITLPFALIQLWGFAKPGLKEAERNATLRYIPFILIMLLIGLSFSYFVVFPSVSHFMFRMNSELGLTATYGIGQYFSFMFNLILPVTVAFQLPTVVLFLTKLRLLNPAKMGKMRRYAYFALVVIATMISPPELVSHLMVAVPLLVLYEVSVVVSKYIYRKQLTADSESGV